MKLFEAYTDKDTFYRSEMNLSRGLEFSISFHITDPDSIYKVHTATFGYRFIFNADTADLIDIESVFAEGTMSMGAKYFEYID